MELLTAVSGRSEVAVAWIDVEDKVLTFEREGYATAHIELQTDTTGAVDLLFLVARSRATDGRSRVAELHDTTTCGEVRRDEGVRPEVELQFTTVALDVYVRVFELVSPVEEP